MGIIRWERGYAEGWDECGFVDWEDVKRFAQRVHERFWFKSFGHPLSG
jgi:hypothetical protein